MPIISGDQAAAKGFEKGTWKLQTSEVGPHWVCASPKFGRVEYAVVADKDGNPGWDRPRYFEAPHVITVPWYLDPHADRRVGLILEARPHAGVDDDGNDLKFWGVPRGFLNPGEDPEKGARREAGEELGAAVVLESRYLGDINPNPTFVGSKGPVVALKVDHKRMEAIRPDRNEKIYKVRFFSAPELSASIIKGRFEDGLLEDGVSLAALMKFFAHFPE